MLSPFVKRHLYIFSLTLVFSIAFFFRFYKLPTIPFGLNNDAAWEASSAVEILKGNVFDYIPYAAEGWRGEGIIRTVVALIMIFIGNNPIAVPISTAIFGVGLVMAVFFLLKRFSWQIAILTSYFIAISGWHITFSKTGWRAVTVPFFTTILFYSFFKGLETKKMVYFILSGAFLSIVSLYTYDAARVVPLFFIFWLIVEIFTRRSFLKSYRKHLVFFFISCFIFSLPMFIYAVNNFENFKSRSDYLFVGHEIEKVGNYSPLIANMTTSLRLFNEKGNGNDFFIFEPLVDIPVSWLLPIGFIVTLFLAIFKKSKKHFFILCWFFASLVPGLLSVPNGNRAIGAIPSVYFFAAAGLFYPINFLSQKFNFKNKEIVASLFIILFCSYSLILTFNDYLGPQRRELAGFYPETVIATNYAKTIMDDYELHFADKHPPELLTYYLQKDIRNNAFTRNFTFYLNSQEFLGVEKTSSKGLAFIMFDYPQNQTVIQALKDKWGNGEVVNLWYENDNVVKRPASVVLLIK